MWGVPIAGPAPDRGMVFQDYGLFPWLTVRKQHRLRPNIARPALQGSQRHCRAIYFARRLAAVCRCLSRISSPAE